MNLTSYFIKHPVVAYVINAMILIVGIICFNSLSVREYPNVEFPVLLVLANYPNASPELVESSVTNILEDKLAGVEGIDTIVSKSKQGSSEIQIEFLAGTSVDRALIAVRDAVSMARGSLPDQVKEPIVQSMANADGVPFMAISLESSTMDFGALTHYAELNLKNAFRSLKGVASVGIWGQRYVYSIKLDPKKMYSFGVNTDEVYDAIAKGNLSLPVGKFRNEIPTTLNTELKTVEDYQNLLIKEKRVGANNTKIPPVFLKSIAEIELKTDAEQSRVRINGKPGLALGIQKASDANPLEVSDLIHKQVQEIGKDLPSGLKMRIGIDQAQFIRSSLKNIQASIVEAIIFVLAIVFLFLRNIRATLIPIITIPISLIGSILFLKIFGFSINIMTLLAMVLAVGLVVDDAIIVLENIVRHIENKVPPLEAAIKGSREIGFAIVAMTLTLTSVYMPIAFIKGAVGQLFIEFAVALAGSVLISGVVALTLSPLMCSKILKINSNHMWPQIDVFLDRITALYSKALGCFINSKKIVFMVAGCAFVLMIFLFNALPSEMSPKEDRGLVGVFIPPVAGENFDDLERRVVAVTELISSTPEAAESLSFMGHWGGNVVLPLKPRSERKRSSEEIVNSLRPQMMNFPSADVWPWSWDSGLPGIGDAMQGGNLNLVISTTDSYRTLLENIDKLKKSAVSTKNFESVRHNLNLDSPSYMIDLNLNALSELNLNKRQIAKTIEVFFSGDRSLSFQKDGVLYPIYIKGIAQPWTLNELYVTNSNGVNISLGSIATLKTTTQPKELSHYNQMRSANITAELFPGTKIESVMPLLMQNADENLPTTYKKSWAGAAKLHKESSHTMIILFLLAIVFIYAILAVQFENFIDPLVILLTVPLACSGALLVTWLFKQSLNIYTQVGLITLIGLITKHGILIVEFANQLRDYGVSPLEAVQRAAVLRLRPILMTTGAMIFGAIPLVISQDSGSEARHVIGAVLIGGLSVGTLLTLFILPTLYTIALRFKTLQNI